MFSLTPNAVTHATLAVWSSVALVGWVGKTRVAAPPAPPAAVAEQALVVETLSLHLETETRDAGRAGSREAESPPETPPPLSAAPESPAPVTVAPPGAIPAFAVAVHGPVTCAARAASASASAVRVSGAGAGVRTAPPVETLTFGAGDGAQPAPDYPREARRKGREGDVTVRFSVNSAGGVAETLLVAPSPWHELNRAAENTIRTRWRFAPGRARLYEITIRFRLTS